MRKVFRGLAIALVAIVVAQFFFAAVGGFSTAPREDAYRPHHVLGYVIFVLPLVMMIVAALARMPRRLMGLLALVAGLVAVQVLIANAAKALGEPGDNTTGGPLLFGLHAVNGLVILATTLIIVRQTPTLAKSTTEPARDEPAH
jgi:FtsH-binding integral membrane protein